MHRLPRIVAFAMMALLAALASGCSPAQQVVGKWDLDTARVMKQNEETDVTKRLMAEAVFKLVKVQIDFHGDGNYAVTGSFPGVPGVEKKGSWRYVKMDGKALVLMVKEAGKTDEDELRISLTDADHADISMPSMALPGQKDSMPFVRVKPAS
jgi:hypothetical protein